MKRARTSPAATDARPLPSRFAGPEQSPGFLLWKVSNAWQRQQRAALQPLGLTHAQFVILATVTWFGEAETLTQAKIAKISGIDAMTTSQVVRALEAAALLERREHPSDPRAKAIAATAVGKKKAQKALPIVEAVDAAFFAPLAKDTTSLMAMFRVLARDDD
jgi:DNA-binding MarR family transcriptional regulator